MHSVFNGINLLLLFSVSLPTNAEKNDFDDLLEYVNENINYANDYTLPTDNSELATVNDTEIYDYGSFDFIIVGGGTAGTLLARRIIENTNWRVLLLEAGNDGNNFTDIPYMNKYTRFSEYNWGFTTVPQEKSCLGMVDKVCVYPTGKGLGGTQVIGDSVYARGNKLDFDGWAELGVDGWSYDELLPYFKKTEQIQIPSYEEDYHGVDGLLKINYTTPDSINYDYYLEAAKLAGSESIDYNGKHQIGISKLQWTIDFNKRVTGGNAFITPIIDTTTNLNVTLNAFATKILFTNTGDEIRATGIQFVKGGKIYQATANKEVILSGGAISSPQLLLLSGVGPAEDLEALNIPVVKDLPVGRNLMDHPVYVGLYIRTNLTADADDVSYNLQRWLEGLGLYTTILNVDNILLINTKNPGVEPPNVELLTINNPASVPAAKFYNLNAEYTDVFSSFNTLTDFLIYCVNLEPKSRGWLKLRSTSPADFPLINPGYLTDAEDADIQVLYESIQYALNLIYSEPLQAINATVVSQAPDCEDEKNEKDYWYCAIRSLTSSLYHPGCTTRMGKDPTTSVVDASLKVHGISSLRVVDGGSLPKLIRGHPLAIIWAMAEKAADLIKAEHESYN